MARGPSISVKMILTTTALIVLVVVGFGALNLWNVGLVYDENTSDVEARIRKSLLEVGSATVATLASSTRPFLQGSDVPNLRKYVGDFHKKNRDEITLAYVLGPGPEHEVIWHSDPARWSPEGFTPNGEDSWKKVLEAWQARKDDPKQQDPLIGGLEYVGPDGKMALFALPVFNESLTASVVAAIDPEAANKPIGFVVLGYTYQYLDKALTDLRLRREAAFRETGVKAGAVGGIFVLFGTILAILQGLRISRPIKVLANRAGQIAQGDLQSRVEVTSTDEIGVLGENFNHMADQLVLLLQATAEKATLEKELEVARTIQDTLVPSDALVDRQVVKLAGYFLPATQCGGDWWTFHDLPGGRILVVIGDVTGHGVPSAMITAAAKSACDVARAVHDDEITCSRLLSIMNHAIYESAKRKFVMTCFASIIDPKAGTITFANAGHNFPYIYRMKDGKGEFASLMIRGNRLGDSLDSQYQDKTMPIGPGDVIIWYTDGIIECENEKGEEYGEKRFRASIRRAGDLEPDSLRDVIVNSSMQFFGDVPRKDDITMVVGKVYS